MTTLPHHPRPRPARRAARATPLLLAATLAAYGTTTLGAGTSASAALTAAAAPTPVVHYAFDDDPATGVVTDSVRSRSQRHARQRCQRKLGPRLGRGRPHGAGPAGRRGELGRGVRHGAEAASPAPDLTVSARVKWDGMTQPWQWIYALGKDNSRYLFTTPVQR